MQQSSPLSVVRDVACTQCGCVCDDLTITVQDSRLVSFAPGCSLAEPWFASLQTMEPSPAARVHGQSVALEEALDAAAQILRTSRSPLVYGLSRSSTAGQRAAVELADRIGATVDTTASVCHAPSIMALQAVGENTSTLGEVRHRSDLVIYWGSNPLVSHPRHVERFVDGPGRLVPQGRAGRHVVVVDVRRTATADIADTFLQITPGSDFDVLTTLRAVLQGQEVSADHVGGVPTPALRDLAERMQRSQYGAVFFGLGLTRGHLGHQNVESLLKLVTELNSTTKFVARRMRILGDVSGADSVLCWQTGYPFSVSLNRTTPRYNPGEFTASRMLERGDADSVVLVGMQGIELMSEAARLRLRQLPTILLDYPNADQGPRGDLGPNADGRQGAAGEGSAEPAAFSSSGFEPTVRFQTAIYGVHRPGVVYRMDEVPVPLRSFLPSSLPSDDEVLQQLLSRLLPGDNSA